MASSSLIAINLSSRATNSLCKPAPIAKSVSRCRQRSRRCDCCRAARHAVEYRTGEGEGGGPWRCPHSDPTIFDQVCRLLTIRDLNSQLWATQGGSAVSVSGRQGCLMTDICRSSKLALLLALYVCPAALLANGVDTTAVSGIDRHSSRACSPYICRPMRRTSRSAVTLDRGLPLLTDVVLMGQGTAVCAMHHPRYRGGRSH